MALCSNGKCLRFIPIKKACFVLAIINAIANGVILIWCCFVGLILILFGGGYSIKIGGVRFKRSIEDDIEDYWIPFDYLLSIFALFSLLSFIFSVMLAHGVKNRRWRLVKPYFIYGCVITVLALLSSVVQLFTRHKLELALWGFFGCVLHSMFLVLVHQTHKLLLKDAMIMASVRLSDIEDSTSLI